MACSCSPGSFGHKLIEALDKIIQGSKSKSWTLALGDFNALATEFNSRIEAFTNKKLGTTMTPASQEVIQAFNGGKHRIYRFNLVGENRKKILMTMFTFAIENTGNYPVLVLGDNLQVMGVLPHKDMLEQQFLLSLSHANSQFSQALLNYS